jgi:endonuclease YncB( thermonuclease family)
MLSLVAASVISCLSLSAVDGDTIKCNGQNMRLLGNGEPFKSGIDTPEIGNAKCPKERLLGEQAKLRLAELLRLDRVTIEDSGKKDRYKRPLVRVRLPNGSTAGQTLIEEGYAIRWKPGVERTWCK